MSTSTPNMGDEDALKMAGCMRSDDWSSSLLDRNPGTKGSGEEGKDGFDEVTLLIKPKSVPEQRPSRYLEGEVRSKHTEREKSNISTVLVFVEQITRWPCTYLDWAPE